MRKTLLKFVLVVVATFALMLGAAFAAGLRMPARIDVTRTLSINRPPENVWWVLTDYDSFPLWHPQYSSARIISSLGEKPTRWQATYTDGRTANMLVSEEKAPSRYVERIADADLPFSGGWELDLERRELTTQVTVHSHSEMHRPLDRVLVRLFVKPELEVEKILEGLKRRVEGSTIKPSAATS